MKQLLACLILALTLTACGDPTVIKPAHYQDISGWRDDSMAAPFALFVDSCHANEKRDRAWASKKEGPVGVRENWERACAAADQLGQPTDAQARQFFESYFAPYKIETEAQSKGQITGYYEPILRGSRTRKAPYLTPVYGVPSDLHKPYLSREEIVRGDIKGRAKVLLYVDDPVALFFLHIQGSGKVKLTDGSMVGLQYAAQNGYSYVPIGKLMKDRGYINDISLQSIRDWLKANPEQRDEVMNQNPSYVFFKFGPGDRAAKGALGLPLTALRSIAIDDDRAAYGVPTFIDTTKMQYGQSGPVPLKRLFVSQDTGGALHGPARADLFYGQGPAAEFEAGHQNTRANVYWLLPLAEGPHVTVPPLLQTPNDAAAPVTPLNEPEPLFAPEPAPLAAPTAAPVIAPATVPAPAVIDQPLSDDPNTWAPYDTTPSPDVSSSMPSTMPDGDSAPMDAIDSAPLSAPAAR